MKSKPRRVIRVTDEPIELDVLVLLHRLRIKQPQWLDVIGLFAIQVDRASHKVAVFLNDGCGSWLSYV